jgi:hypothetical protein
MTMNSQPGIPDWLDFSLGCWECEFIGVEWKEGDLLFWNKSHALIREPSKTLRCTPDEDGWRSFWAAMDRIDVWNWKKNYEPEGMTVLDGTQWHLELRHNGRTIRTKGDNAYPGGYNCDFSADSAFGQFLAALGELTGRKECCEW